MIRYRYSMAKANIADRKRSAEKSNIIKRLKNMVSARSRKKGAKVRKPK